MTFTAKINWIGGGAAVMIPDAVARKMNLSEGMPLRITMRAGEMVIRKRPHRRRRLLSSIVANIKRESYRRRSRELSDGGPVGKELLV